tara:strand:- start:639 stop:1001 length:363 start_codon:yes stop_codon:yes gene_type:complete
LKTRKSKTTAGATTAAERKREENFKRELKKFFPEELEEINFTYSSISLKHEAAECWEKEGTYGYFMNESILIGGQPISIAWLPHIKDMTDKQVSYMAAEVASCIKLKGEKDEGTAADKSE